MEKQRQEYNIILKNAWIKQLAREWETINYQHFNSRMKLPVIDLIDTDLLLGKWEGGIKRTLSISTNLIANYSWRYTNKVLGHEMAHQYIDEILKIRDERDHGETFKKLCRDKGFDHAACGSMEDRLNRNNNFVNREEHKILDKIQKLFSLAQSPNRHEAESAMTKAYDLLLKHNLSSLLLNKRNFISKQLGRVERKSPIKSKLGGILTKFFFVEGVWCFSYDQHRNQTGKILEIYGTPENVELAEYVHEYLINISEKLWQEYKKEHKIKGDIHRRTFIYGLLDGFYKKLDATKETNQKNSLIWTGDPHLKDFFHKRNPKLRRSYSSHSKSCNTTYRSGIELGKELVINKGLKQDATGKVYLLTKEN